MWRWQKSSISLPGPSSPIKDFCCFWNNSYISVCNWILFWPCFLYAHPLISGDVASSALWVIKWKHVHIIFSFSLWCNSFRRKKREEMQFHPCVGFGQKKFFFLNWFLIKSLFFFFFFTKNQSKTSLSMKPTCFWFPSILQWNKKSVVINVNYLHIKKI